MSILVSDFADRFFKKNPSRKSYPPDGGLPEIREDIDCADPRLAPLQKSPFERAMEERRESGNER